MSGWFVCGCCRKRQPRDAVDHHLEAPPEPESAVPMTRLPVMPALTATAGTASGTTTAEKPELSIAHKLDIRELTAGASAPSTPPDSFLINGNVNNAASSWDINTSSPAWHPILTDPTLGLKINTPSGTTLSVSSSAFWDLTFSNSANAAMFGNTSPVVSLPSNTNVQGAVLGLPSPAVAALSSAVTFASIRAKFGITNNNSTALLTSLVNAIDGSGALQVKLNPASSPTSRNALWAVPGSDAYRVAISLVFEFTTAGTVAQIQSLLNKYFGLNLSISSVAPQVVMTSITSYTTPSQGSATPLTVSSTYRMELRVQIASFRVSAIFTPDGMSLALSDLGPTPPAGKTIYQRLSDEVGMSAGPGAAKSPGANDIPDSSKQNATPFDKLMSGVMLWYVQIGLNGQSKAAPGAPAPSPTLSNVFWQVGLLAKIQPASSPKAALAAITFDTRVGVYEGRLLFSGDAPSPNALRQYDLETWTIPPAALDFSQLSQSVDLAAVFGGSKPPPQVPSQITHAVIQFAKSPSSGGYSFHIACAITGGPPPAASTNGNAAPASFDFSSVELSLFVSSDGSSTTSDIQVLSSTLLDGSQAAAPNPPMLYVNLEYMQGSYWRLEADAENIPIATLSNHFDPNVRAHAVGALGKLMVKDVHMLYVFNSQGDASSFLITAVILLGDLELDLYYQYDTPLLKPTDKSAGQIAWGDTPPADITFPAKGPTPAWKFEAFLGATSPNSTIGSIITSITGDAKAVSLPDFLKGIQVNAASGGNAAVKLIMDKDTSGNLVLAFQIVLSDLDFTYATVWPASPAAGGSSSASKTVLRVGVDKIPLIDQIPLVNELPQPFDKLEYLYVDDGGTGVGLAANEIDGMINPLLPDGAPKFDYQKTNGAGTNVAVLQAGHHFMVVNGSDVILDHIFHGATTPDSSPAQPQSLVVVHDAPATAPDDPPPTKGKVDVQLPFLSISAVTLKFKGLKLYLDIDATMTLGPIQGSVIGFEVALDLSKVKLNHLENMLKDGDITFGVHGLAIAVDQDPLEIAGVFIHDTQPGPGGVSIERYAGGVSVDFEEWQFTAVGAYEVITVTQGSGGEYKSVFVYAKLNGPLFTLAFATVSGVRVGFGYNSIVRSPSMAEMPQFPFLNDQSESGSGSDPMKLLLSFMDGDKPWVSPKEDSYWVAAGLTLTAFGILSVTAVLMLGFHDGGVVISVFADGIAQMPPDVGPDTTLFYVEIFMLAELNTVEGYFTVQASLAPSSHILVSSCRLTGGFALVNWFDPSTHSGDFVFTVGGYHPAYTPPPWYPVPARLGLAFTLGDMINVTGNAYFAITPKCVMGGGALHLGLDVGPVSAWLDVALDVFIQFKPFHYTADMMVSVGCAITINVWFVHVRISVSVGAQLHIEGPDPFGGFANVDFYLFSFTIHFGGSAQAPPPLPLHDFYEMVKTPGPATSRQGTSTTDPATSQLKFVLTAGIIPNSNASSSSQGNNNQFPDSGANAVWDTKSGSFACSIDCDFALSDAHIVTFQSTAPNTPNTTSPILLPAGEATPPSIYSKPMHAGVGSKITSTLEVLVWQFQPDGSKQLYSGTYHFTGTLVLKDVPAALWGVYDATADPAAPSSSPSPAALADPSAPTVRLAMGVQLAAPESLLYPGLNMVDFDPSIAFREPVLRLPGAVGGGAPWEIPTADLLQAVELASGEVDKDAAPADRWNKVQSDWTSFAGKGAAVLGGKLDGNGVPAPGLLTLAASTLGWDVATPSSALSNSDASAAAAAGAGSGAAAGGTSSGPPSWLLNGALPELLVGNLGSQYPVLPRYSAAGTAT